MRLWRNKREKEAYRGKAPLVSLPDNKSESQSFMATLIVLDYKNKVRNLQENISMMKKVLILQE